MPNTPPNFECHITVHVNEEDVPSLQAYLAQFPQWSFSRIAGDPVLGKQTFCYATAHFESRQLAIYMTVTMAELIDRLFTVVRRKVEEVVWDSRREQGWDPVTRTKQEGVCSHHDSI